MHCNFQCTGNQFGVKCNAVLTTLSSWDLHLPPLSSSSFIWSISEVMFGNCVLRIIMVESGNPLRCENEWRVGKETQQQVSPPLLFKACAIIADQRSFHFSSWTAFNGKYQFEWSIRVQHNASWWALVQFCTTWGEQGGGGGGGGGVRRQIGRIIHTLTLGSALSPPTIYSSISLRPGHLFKHIYLFHLSFPAQSLHFI